MYLVLGKKRIIKGFSIFIVVLIVCVMCCANGKRNEEIIQTSSKNSNEKIVVLDAGHGQPDRAGL